MIMNANITFIQIGTESFCSPAALWETLETGLFETCDLLCQISLLRSALSALSLTPLFLTSLHTHT